MSRLTKSTNPTLRKLIRQLREQGKAEKAKVWLELAERLDGSRRSRAEVNLSQLNRYATADSTVVVPGKILAAGRLERPMTFAAFKYSATAKRKIAATGGKALTIPQLLELNPAGKNLKLME